MSFDARQRELLGQLADQLIPSAGEQLSASAAQVSGPWLDAVLTARPDLRDGLANLLQRSGDQEVAEFVADLRSSDPAAYGVLAEVVSGAYFMNPEVRKAIGYHGQTSHTIDPHPDYLDDGLLESVISRGPIYRPTPGKSR